MFDPDKLHEYVGVFHIHTTDSDGTKDHDYIINLAQKYNLDFITFNDHMTLAHKDKEGWYGKLLVLVGYEHEDPEGKNHYLIFGVDKVLPADMTPAEYVRRTRQVGGFGIIAHPDERRDFPKFPPLPWTDWSVRGFDGIEIWNHMSAWLEGIAQGNKLKYLLNPRSLLSAPPPETLRRWDKISLRRRVVGIGSADAHGFKLELFGVFWRTVFPYKVELNSIRTHILTKRELPKDFAAAKEKFFRTLRQCRAFISNHRWGDARGFRFWAQTPSRYAIVGDSINVNSKLALFVKAPQEAEIVLIRNGERVSSARGSSAKFPAKRPGVYRVELWREGKVWIISNHIRVTVPRGSRNGGKTNSQGTNSRGRGKNAGRNRK